MNFLLLKLSSEFPSPKFSTLQGVILIKNLWIHQFPVSNFSLRQITRKTYPFLVSSPTIVSPPTTATHSQFILLTPKEFRSRISAQEKENILGFLVSGREKSLNSSPSANVSRKQPDVLPQNSTRRHEK